jgi:uncharacterized membrane protein YhhN
VGPIGWTCVVLTAVGVAAQLLFRARGHLLGEGLTKLLSSTCFLVLVVVCADGRWEGPPAWIAVGLVASFLGDGFLIGRGRAWVGPGLAAFLLAHLAYLAAAAPLVDLARVSPLGLTLVLGGALIAGAHTFVLIRPRLGPLLLPAFVYTVILGLMTVVMVCAWLSAPSRPGRTLLAVGAVAFLISDVAVARQRFTEAGYKTRVWGLPSYYGAQVLFAIAAGRLGA